MRYKHTSELGLKQKSKKANENQMLELELIFLLKVFLFKLFLLKVFHEENKENNLVNKRPISS